MHTFVSYSQISCASLKERPMRNGCALFLSKMLAACHYRNDWILFSKSSHSDYFGKNRFLCRVKAERKEWNERMKPWCKVSIFWFLFTNHFDNSWQFYQMDLHLMLAGNWYFFFFLGKNGFLVDWNVSFSVSNMVSKKLVKLHFAHFKVNIGMILVWGARTVWKKRRIILAFNQIKWHFIRKLRNLQHTQIQLDF